MTSFDLDRVMSRKFRFRHMELIADVHDCRSILKASRRMNLTQPAVTKAVKEMEATLNFSLFERTSRGLTPTVYGEILARHAKIVRAQLRHAAEELENFRVGYSGHVSVGTLLAASAQLLPEAVSFLKRERPGVAITVIDGTFDMLLPLLIVGDLDMVLGRLPEVQQNDGLLFEEFYKEPTCLVIRHGHPLARRRRLELGELVNQPWLLPLPGTMLRRQVDKAFLDAHLPLPTNVIESMSVLTNRVILRSSDCVGVMPYHVALDDVRHGLLNILPVTLHGIEGHVGAILRAPGDLPPAAAALMNRLREIGHAVSEAPPFAPQDCRAAAVICAPVRGRSRMRKPKALAVALATAAAVCPASGSPTTQTSISGTSGKARVG
jgi:DNA-binding transcriptional LysR family regulator